MSAESIDRFRRCDLAKMADVEKAIHAAMAAVEAMPGDVRLSDAGALLHYAWERVADYVDGVPRRGLDLHFPGEDVTG